MKCISIRQPWAWAIIHAGKDIENRTWETGYRGPVLIHAAKGMTQQEYADFCEFFSKKVGRRGITPPSFERLTRGGIVGRADIIACVREHPSPWFFGPYGFVLANVEPLPFRPCLGKLGLFDVEVVAA